MKQPTYTMQRIALSECSPHADAEAYSASSDDRAALANSIGETGVLSPIAVIPGDEGRGWFVIDGIGRLNALIAAGATETDAQVFDLGGLSVAEFVVCKNAMMRKVTTGTRVMAYLKCHEREVLAAADPEKYKKRPLNSDNFKRRSANSKQNLHAVSCETAWDKGWSAKEISGRIGVSKQDVLAGIELLKATAEVAGEGAKAGGREGYTQLELFETAEAVLRGETPIRRWRAAAGGKVSKVGGKAAADYAAIGVRTMASLAGLWKNWQTVPMEFRGPILEKFAAALADIPEDFRAVVAREAREWALAQVQGAGKKRG
ncbi:MAG: ParB N-terminal domain-containing protein [Kiritimatiellia bacterium]